jgi:hypothetical protein
VLLPLVSTLTKDPAALAVGAWAALLIELSLVFGLPHRRARPYAIGLGIALHLGIFGLMSVVTFGVLMVSSYVLFYGVADEAHGSAHAA